MKSCAFFLIFTSVALLFLAFASETGCRSVSHLPDQCLLWPYYAAVLRLVLIQPWSKQLTSAGQW